MKKNLSVILILLLFSAILRGQNDSLPNHKWAVSVAYNSVDAQLNQFVVDAWGRFAYSNLTSYFGDRKDRSFSLSVTPERLLRNNFSLRCEIGYTLINLSSYYNGVNDSGATGVNETLIKRDTLTQSIFRLNPEFFWTIRKNRCSLLFGFSLNLTLYSETKWIDHLSDIYVNNSHDLWRGTTPGGYSIGPGFFTGFEVRILPWISAGATISTSLVYYTIGGIQTGTHYLNNPPTSFTRNWSVSNNKASGFQFTKVMPSIGIKFNF